MHVGHCIEFLRQALICHADANLETLNETSNGATGWGSSRVCGDFEKVKAFAEAYRFVESDDIV